MAGVRLRVLFSEMMADNCELGLCLCRRHAGREAANNVKEIRFANLHSRFRIVTERSKYARFSVQLEARGCDADDCIRFSVKNKRHTNRY